MAHILNQGSTPDVISNGSIVMSIRYPVLNIRIINSLNFLPMALTKLPGCFELSELIKRYFPHLFKRPENQNYVGPLPDSSFTTLTACHQHLLPIL